MSKIGSVFSMGSGGATYEHSVQAAYLLAMLLKLEIPLVTNGRISEVAFQTTRRGFATDDLLIVVNKGDGNSHTILGQIKYNVALTEANDTFNEVMIAFWKDFNHSNFNQDTDRLLLVKSNLTNNDKKHFNVLLDWASTHHNEIDFYQEVERIAIKKQHLKIFENILKRANDGSALSKDQVWKFLRSMAIVAYDFTTETSTAYATVLNLINLSKSVESKGDNTKIWNELIVLASQYNLNGGSLSYQNIIQLEITKNFDPSVITNSYAAISKLREDGRIIIEPFSSTIQDFHLDRSEKLEELLEVSSKHQVTIVSGNAGAGKSALLKDFLDQYCDNIEVFVFKAEQFNEPTLSQVFNTIGVTHTVNDVLTTIGFLNEKIIVIDSLEKLLEANPENAFQQFITQINSIPGVRVIFTSRAYAVNLILQKYLILDVGAVEIELLSDEELSKVRAHFPQLAPYFNNLGIKEILRSPKYLEFAVNTIGVEGFDVAQLSLINFKSKLWSHIIEKSTITGIGMARKRGKAFSNIAIKRAKSMRLFVEPDDGIDEATVEALMDDHIVYKSNSDFLFAPSHDILEDWALVRHLSKLKYDAPTVEDFFNQINNQPAFRRAFRLWMEDYLFEDEDAIVALIRATIDNEKIDKYWVDEILVSVFRSDDCSPFFENFKDNLLNNDAAFLVRCIMLARTTCKEYGFGSETNKSLLFPVGNVWQRLLEFIARHVASLSNQRDIILALILDWEFRFMFEFLKASIQEIEACKQIVFFFIEQIEAADEFWLHKFSRDKSTIQQLIYFTLRLTAFSKIEVKSLLHRANTKQERAWGVGIFYEMLIKTTLGGIRNQALIKELPDVLIALADDHWKKKPEVEVIQQPVRRARKISSFLPPPEQKKEESWGIDNRKYEFYPSGVYKTFVNNLFYVDADKAVAFITDFINYSVESYIDSDYGIAHPLQIYTLQLTNGDEVLQYGDLDLWIAYRGLGHNVHTLIESLLMTLDRFLLQLAENSNDILLEGLDKYCAYILKNSNNVALTSVIASAFMSKPESFKKTVLPLFGTKEFYDWDLSRCISELHVIAPVDNEISYAQKERFRLNKLPHRQQYYQGLRGYMISYQFNRQILNAELFQIFDSFYENYQNDHIWIKTVAEMDIRKLKPGKVDEEKGTVELAPLYPEGISETIEELKRDYKDNQFNAVYGNLLRQAVDDKTEVTLEKWIEIYHFYTVDGYQYEMFDTPVSLAKIGLSKLEEHLNREQKRWCLDSISAALQGFVNDKYSRNYGSGLNYRLLDKDSIINSIHLLLKFAPTEELHTEYKQMIGYLVVCPIDDQYLQKFLTYFRTQFTENCAAAADDIIKLVVGFAEFEKQAPRPYYQTSPEEIAAYEDNFTTFIQTAIIDPVTINPDNVDFESHDKHLVIRAFLMIAPKTCNEIELNYIKKVLTHFVQEHTVTDGDTWRRSNQKFDYTSQSDIQLFLGRLLLYSREETIGKEILKILIDPFLSEHTIRDQNINDLYKFVDDTLMLCTTIMYDIVNLEKEKLPILGNRFWSLWKFLFEELKGNNNFYFGSKLLLDNKYLKAKEDWEGFLNYKSFYLEMADYYSITALSSIIAVFSSFGEKVFLPDGLLLLEKSLKIYSSNHKYLLTKAGQKLIKKLYFNHINVIKNRQDMVNAYLYILGVMIDLGSTEAYLMRENVIVYKLINQ